MSVNFTSRVAAVRSIGAAEMKRDRIAAEIVESVAVDYDWSARGAIPLQVHLWATGTDVKADWPAQKETVKVRAADGMVEIGEDGKPVTKNESTNYGRGVDNIVAGIRKLVAAPKPKPFRLAVTASGDDAPVTGTVEISPDESPELFAALMDMIAAHTSGK